LVAIAVLASPSLSHNPVGVETPRRIDAYIFSKENDLVTGRAEPCLSGDVIDALPNLQFGTVARITIR